MKRLTLSPGRISDPNIKVSVSRISARLQNHRDYLPVSFAIGPRACTPETGYVVKTVCAGHFQPLLIWKVFGCFVG